MNEKQQLLRDFNIKPSDEIIADGLGTANKTYIKFVDELKKYNISLMEWKYYNDGKAWLSKGEYKWRTVRGTNKIKPIFWLSIWKGFFRIAFFFSTSTKAELLSLPISGDIKEIINNVEPMGKTMRFISVVLDVSDYKQLSDVYILGQFKKENM